MPGRIAVIGVGYVGLTTGACFAKLGHEVVCADIDEGKIAMLSEGRIPIHEAKVQKIVRKQLKSDRLRFVVGAENAVPGCEFVFLCLPTPPNGDGSADLSFIECVVPQIAHLIEDEAIVVNKSTVPVGSARMVARLLNRSDVAVVSNPEFLREGSAVYDFLHPDRIVIGSDDQTAAIRVSSLYEKIQAPVLITDAASAETVKYAANAFLATKLSFANAVAAVCEGVGADVGDVMLGLGYDSRVGHEFLKPGPGWGGSCFPKDTRAMIQIADKAGYDFALLRGVIRVNEEQFDRVVDKVERVAGGSLDGVRVGALGLAFKANTGDIRESPALEIIERLVERGAVVRAYDPAVNRVDLPGLDVASDLYAACEGADVVVLLTEWDEFKWLDPDRLASVVGRRGVVDARNILDRAALVQRGFTYAGIGQS